MGGRIRTTRTASKRHPGAAVQGLLALSLLAAAGSNVSGMAYLPVPDGLAPEATSASAGAPPGMADRVVVKKAERRLYLTRGDRILRSYPIGLGFQPSGHKTREGDGRTPEGRYILDRRSERSRFHRALHISYPNGPDRRRAGYRAEPPGGQILVHGQPGRSVGAAPSQDGDWTLGCIAVSNPAIEEIWSLTRDGTPIDILP